MVRRFPKTLSVECLEQLSHWSFKSAQIVLQQLVQYSSKSNGKCHMENTFLLGKQSYSTIFILIGHIRAKSVKKEKKKLRRKVKAVGVPTE